MNCSCKNCRNTSLQWYSSYLNDRRQIVSISNTFYDLQQVWNSLPDRIKSLPTFPNLKKTFSLSKFRWLHLKNDPRCVCGHLFEDAIHFFLECPLYQHDRTSLFNYFNNIVSISIEYILFGCNEISEELNTLLFNSVQKIIRQTCRFNH